MINKIIQFHLLEAENLRIKVVNIKQQVMKNHLIMIYVRIVIVNLLN